MKDEIISLETAKLAKEKGFDIRQETFYNEGSGWSLQSDSIIRTGKDEFLEAPTQSLLAKWLREVHMTDIVVRRTASELGYHWYIQGCINEGYGKTYEVALEEALQEALELISQNS